MKTFGAHRCLLIATISLVAAVLPFPGIAQEQAPTDAQTAAPPQVSEQRFVSDKLVLNVYAEPDQSSARVATIQTGDAVEELERSGNLVRVRLEDGREGWVGANYLTRDAPAIVRLRELQRDPKAPAPAPGPDKKSIDEIARLKKDNTTLQTQINELQSRLAAAATPVDEGTQPEEIPEPEPEVASEEGGFGLVVPPPPTGVLWWTASLIAVVLAGALGFAGGYQMLARRIRRKFGGLRIY